MGTQQILAILKGYKNQVGKEYGILENRLYVIARVRKGREAVQKGDIIEVEELKK